MNRRFYLLFAVLALLAWGIMTLLRHGFQGGPGVGETAPAFSLQDRRGDVVTLESLRGRVVLLNFWATWCGPCRHEMPSLEALSQRYRHRNFTVVGLSEDEGGWDDVDEFLKIVSVSFPVLLDRDMSVSEKYGTFRIPESYLIDPQGKIFDKFVGPQDYDQTVFYRKIERLLEKR